MFTAEPSLQPSCLSLSSGRTVNMHHPARLTLAFLSFKIIVLCVSAWSVYTGTRAMVRMEVRGQLCGIGSRFPPLVGFWGGMQVPRVTPLPAEASLRPLTSALKPQQRSTSCPRRVLLPLGTVAGEEEETGRAL